MEYSGMGIQWFAIKNILILLCMYSTYTLNRSERHVLEMYTTKVVQVGIAITRGLLNTGSITSSVMCYVCHESWSLICLLYT